MHLRGAKSSTEMEKSMGMENIPVIDSHIHIRGYHDLKNTLAVAQNISEKCSLAGVNVLALSAWDADSAGQNVLCMACKALYPETYAYANFDYFYEGVDKTAMGRLEQLKAFMAMGFDGVKLIETKPSSRKFVGIGLDDESYELCFDYMEKEQIPIIWHVADPEENWDAELCGEYAKEHGWYYGDGTFLSKEELYQETFRVLDRHPGLKVTFAHMLFLTKDIRRAAEVMEKYPNVRLDITPGCELYFNFDADYEGWRNFLLRYQDRIVFGTDNGWGDEPSPAEKVESGSKIIRMLKEYFSTENIVEAWDGKEIKGMNLPKEALERIFAGNFMELQKGKKSKPINLAQAVSYGKNVLERTKGESAIGNDARKQLEELVEMLSAMEGNG